MRIINAANGERKRSWGNRESIASSLQPVACSSKCGIGIESLRAAGYWLQALYARVSRMKHPIAVLLHNIRSAHNVGAIFRTADAAGVSKIYLSGYTPTPIDRFKRPQKEIAKTALGAESFIPWEYAKTPGEIIKARRADGLQIVGVEQDKRSRDYRAFKPEKPTLLIFGNEVRGLSPQVRSMCDDLIHIPMFGKKESLNVATTAGIILFSTL